MLRRMYRTYTDSFGGLPRAAWLLSLVVLINRSGSMVLFFLSLYLTSQLGFNIELAGYMISIYGAGSLLGTLLGGWLTDRWGPAWVQFYSLAFGGLSLILLAHVNVPVSIGAMLFISALLNEALRPANITAFAEVCPPDIRARGFALNRLAINLGVAIGPAVGGFLVLINYKLIFWVDGITCLLAAVLFHRLIITKNLLHVPNPQSKTAAVQSPYRDLVFMSVLALLFLMGLAFIQIFNTWPLYLRQVYGLFEDQIGILLAINALLVALIEMPLVHRFERHDHLRIIAIGSIFLFGGFALLPMGNSYVFAIFTVVLWTIGEILVFPLVGSFIANRSSDSNRGKYMGLFSFTFALAFVSGPTSGSYIYNSFGPDILWYSMGFLGVLVFAGYEGIRYVLNSSRHTG